MINGDSFFKSVADAVYGEELVNATTLREMVVNYMFLNPYLFPGIVDMDGYNDEMIQPGAPVDRNVMQALANELELDISIYVDGYTVLISGPENTTNTYVDLFFSEGEYLLLRDVFEESVVSEESVMSEEIDDFVNISQVRAMVLAEDDVMLFRTMIDAGIIDINELDSYDNNLLEMAIMARAANISIMLVHELCLYNEILGILLEENSSTMLDAMVNAGIININGIDAYGNSLLHLAVMADATEIAAVLVTEYNFDTNFVNAIGYRVVDYATSSVMQYVLDSQVDLGEVMDFDFNDNGTNPHFIGFNGISPVQLPFISWE